MRCRDVADGCLEDHFGEAVVEFNVERWGSEALAFTGSVRLEHSLLGRSWTAHADRHQKSADVVLERRTFSPAQRRRFFGIGFRSSPSCALNFHS